MDTKEWKRAFVFNLAKIPRETETKQPEKLKIYETDITVQIKEYFFTLIYKKE